jgi:hypothetical protein
MNQEPLSQATARETSPAKSGKWWDRVSNNRFLFVSIIVHVLFCIVAAYFVVQQVSTKRKLTFMAAPPAANPGKNTTEHKVQMAKKQHSMSIPTQAKRVTTTGFSKVALADMPSMPMMAMSAPNKMLNAAGAVSFGEGSANGAGAGPIPFFGFAGKPSFGALKGTLIDLKQTRERQPTKIVVARCDIVVSNFAKEGFRESDMSTYFRGPHPLYMTQICIPEIPSAEGPDGFGLKGIVRPDMWIVHYKGKVAPPETGTYYFVGEADDYMYIKFDHRMVLDSCWDLVPHFLEPTAVYNYNASAFPHPFKRGYSIQVEAGRYYDIEIVIGDHGGMTSACLLMEKEGVQYEKDGAGNPILPPFKLAPGKLPPPIGRQTPLRVVENGPIWKAASEGPTSVLDLFKNAPAGKGQ